MREVLLLLKKDITKFFWFLQNFGEATKSKKMSRKLLMIVIFILSIGFSLFSVFQMMGGMYRSAAGMGAEALFFQSLVLSFTILIILTIVPYALSKLYYGKGIISLISLPLKPRNILMASTYYISFSFLLYALLIALPAMLEHQGMLQINPLYYLLGFVSLFSYSVILSSIICFAVIVLMKLISRFPKSKNLMQMLGMFILLAFIVAIQIYAPKMSNPNYSQSFDSFKNLSDFASNLNVFLPFKLTADSLAKTNIVDMLLPIGGNIVIGLVLSLYLAEFSKKMWLSGLNNMSQVSKVKVKKGFFESAKLYQQRNVVIQIAKKDIKNVMSTPVYIFNILLSGIMVPLIMMIVTYIQLPKSWNLLDMIHKGLFDTFFGKLPIDSLNFYAFALVLGLAIGAMTALYGSSASSTLTREGKSIWLTQVLPISIKEQVNGRLLAGTILMMVTNFALIAIIEFILRAPLGLVLAAIAGSVFSSIAIIAYSLFIDTVNPKLSWDTPQEAVKQNLNLFLAVFLDIGYIALHVFLIYKFLDYKIITMDTAYIGALILVAIQLVVFFLFRAFSMRMMKAKLSKYSA